MSTHYDEGRLEEQIDSFAEQIGQIDSRPVILTPERVGYLERLLESWIEPSGESAALAFAKESAEIMGRQVDRLTVACERMLKVERANLADRLADEGEQFTIDAIRDNIRALELALGLLPEGGPLCEALEKTEKQRDELLAACSDCMALVDEGLLVRDTSGDDQPDWVLKALALTKRLVAIQAAIARCQPAEKGAA